jgi:inosine/xanthosine triphosphatase
MEEMKINVGSLNKAKIDAVSEILQDYPHLSSAKIEGVETSSGVSDQPKTLQETIEGARNRAINAYDENCDYSVGIESGLMEVPHTKSGYMDVCAAAIHDGKETHLGLSSAWEFPDKEITRSIVEDGLDMAQAINKAGLTSDPKIGAGMGAIGILTKGRLDRKGYTKQALMGALVHIDPLDQVNSKNSEKGVSEEQN